MATLLVFGEDWGGHPSSTQHLMPYISEDFQVIWVNSIGLRRPQSNLRDCKRIISKLLAKFKRSAEKKVVEPAPFPVIAPLVIPLPKTSFERWINKKLLHWQLKPLHKNNDPLWVWTSLPSAVDFKGLFGEQGWVYYCGDDFSALAGVDHSTVESRETELADIAQRIWVASPTLVQRFIGKPVTLIEHGVDYRLFSEPSKRASELTAKKPTLGFYGALAHWIDQELLIEIADKLPDWELMLVGPTLVDASELLNRPNVRVLAAQPHSALPAFVQHWDAAILPFKDTAQIRACNPLKLREYLASGTPILSTPFPALEDYNEHVYSIQSSVHAVDVLTGLQKTETKVRRIARQQSVQDESWEQRAVQIRAQLSRLVVG